MKIGRRGRGSSDGEKCWGEKKVRLERPGQGCGDLQDVIESKSSLCFDW